MGTASEVVGSGFSSLSMGESSVINFYLFECFFLFFLGLSSSQAPIT